MRILLTTLILLFFVSKVNGQHAFGMSSGAFYSNNSYKGTISDHQSLLDSTFKFRSGLDINACYLLKDFAPPVSSVNQLGVRIYTPLSDSLLIQTFDDYNDPLELLPGIVRSSAFDIDLKFSYEIAPELDVFLLLYAGWGFGYYHNKIKYTIDGYDSETMDVDFLTLDGYDAQGEEKLNTITAKQNGVRILLHGGAFYEFEKFRLFGELGARIPLNFEADNYSNPPLTINFTAGIFIPILRIDL